MSSSGATAGAIAVIRPISAAGTRSSAAGVIAGGAANRALVFQSSAPPATAISTVTGGTGNTAANYWSTVNGGFSNRATGQGSAVNGGQQNTASESYATVSGGYLNVMSAFRGWAGGAYHTP